MSFQMTFTGHSLSRHNDQVEKVFGEASRIEGWP